MGRHSKPDNGNGAHSDEADDGFEHRLPEWFATRGPRPYWLAEYWSMILSVATAVAVFVNTVVFPNLPSVRFSEWVNATMAWIAAAGLFLKGQQVAVHRVAAWRAQVRAEHAAKPKE